MRRAAEKAIASSIRPASARQWAVIARMIACAFGRAAALTLNSRTGVGMIVTLSVVLVAAAAGVVWFFMGNNLS